MATTQPGFAQPSPPPPRKDLFQRVRGFWHRVTEGLELQQLWSQFQTEARTGYRLYSKEVDARRPDVIPRNNWWYTAREFFWAILMKLSPAKRVLLLIGLLLLIVPVVQVNTDGGVSGSNEGIRVIGGLIILMILILETADRVTMKRDLEIAREIQHWLVPDTPPDVPGLDIAFFTRPANTVAGDYYDVVPRSESGKYLIAIADVAGKSMPAALLMATFQASLKTLSAASPSLLDLVTGLNRYACDHSIQGTRFTTAFLAEYDSATCSLSYVNAGHNPPLLLRGSRVEQLNEGGVPLGILADAQYQSGRIHLEPNDTLAIYTDGVVEAQNVAGQEFGEELLIKVLQMVPNTSAQEAIRHLMTNIEAFVATAPQHDDITCMVVRCVQR
ncbi:MAG TPA: PP2C family protein-serine/threonine phosphatase [Terriglobales bacterium]|nr:PP2C family protein-serine/threonine phosphatase [Terriglobales bacterium]